MDGWQGVNEHRAEMNHAVLDAGGTVMQFVGDTVMAVFGPFRPGPPCRSCPGGGTCHARAVAAAPLGSEERLEYTLVGETVNLAQRLQDLGRPAGRIVMSESTYRALREPIEAEPLDSLAVKGRETPVQAYRITMTETTEEGTGE